jgi:hypothetical protein
VRSNSGSRRTASALIASFSYPARAVVPIPGGLRLGGQRAGPAQRGGIRASLQAMRGRCVVRGREAGMASQTVARTE